jgi:putative FmdB family regulatory protein
MPVYTYRCENCGVQFERTQKFSDTPLTRCPECGKKALRKVYTPVGIVFKGSGFYATDHRSPSGMSYAPSSSDEKAADSKPATEKSTETKPAAESKPEPASKTSTSKSKE